MLQNLFFTSLLNISNPVNIPYFDQLFYCKYLSRNFHKFLKFRPAPKNSKLQFSKTGNIFYTLRNIRDVLKINS